MKTDAFITEVARKGEFGTDKEAQQATHAVLTQLAALVTGGEAQDVADQLPDDLHAWVVSTKDKPATGAKQGRKHFVEAIAEQLPGEIGTDGAEKRARVVLTTLRDAITDGEWDDLSSQLPEDFDALLN